MPDSCVQTAMEVYRQPSRLNRIRDAEIPSDALTIIKIASGESKILEEEALDLGVEQESLREASFLYLRTVISSADGNHARALALPRNATLADVKSHKRWLLKWLHPDTNHSAWESQMFHSVNTAAKYFETHPQSLAAEAMNFSVHENRRSKTPSRRNTLQRLQVRPASSKSVQSADHAARLPFPQSRRNRAWRRFRQLIGNRLAWLAFSVVSFFVTAIYILALGV